MILPALCYVFLAGQFDHAPSNVIVASPPMRNSLGLSNPKLIETVTLSGRTVRSPERRFNLSTKEEIDAFRELPSYLRPLPLHLRAIPGYKGYIPNRIPQQVFGTTYMRGNMIASFMGVGQSADQLKHEWGWNPLSLGYRSGSDIPGYTGHIPGRADPLNVGQTVSRASMIANALRKRQLFDLKETYDRQLNAARQMYTHTQTDGNTGLYPVYKNLLLKP